MANSDNVMRGGLTPKHIDIAELIRDPRLHPRVRRPDHAGEDGPRGLALSHPAPEFALWRLEVNGGPPRCPALATGRVAIVTAGAVTRLSAAGLNLTRGQSAFVTAAESVSSAASARCSSVVRASPE